MARPKKQGLDYFQKNVDFYQDIKIRKLIRHKGIQAVSVYDILLCQIYRVGYYISWDDDLPFIISEISDLKEDNILDIINYALSIGLFDQTMYDEHQVLTSHGIQERFFDFCSVAKRKVSADLPYLLVDLSGKIVSSEKQSVITEETIVFPEETIETSEETGENSAKSTQSKVKESKDNNSLRSSLSPSTSPSSVCVCEMEQEKLVDIPMTAREGIEVLKKDRDWLLQMQRKFGLDAGSLVRWLESFSVDCDCLGKQDHNSIADIKQHFNAWMSKQKPKRNGGKKSAADDSAPLTSQQRWNKCHAELCQAVSPEECRQSFDVIRFERFEVSTSKLFIQVPNKETYEYMEHHLVDVMSRIIPKYFGANFMLQYHLP